MPEARDALQSSVFIGNIGIQVVCCREEINKDRLQMAAVRHDKRGKLWRK